MIVVMLVLSLLTACNNDDEQPIVLTLNNDFGASVEGGNFPEGSALVTTPIDETSQDGIAAINAIAEQEYNVFKPVYIFDVSVVKDNAKVQPNGKVKVSIPVTADLASYKTVLHIKDDGAVERLSANYADGKITFETDSFSIFVLVEPVVTNMHTHNFSEEWSQSKTHHWHECLAENCNATQDYAEHYYDDHGWDVEKPATETEDGVKVRVCIGCKYEDRQSIPKLTHVHTYANVWTSDGTKHYHAATCSHTTEKADEAPCSGGTATCTAKAVCSVCENEYGDLAPHSFTSQDCSSKYLASSATCQSPATYYYSCYCGAKGTETFEDPQRKLAYCSYDSTEVCTMCEVPASDWLTFQLRADGESYKVTGVKSVNGRSTKSVLVPNTYNDKPVVEIAHGAFYYNSDVRNIVLSDNVKIVGGDCTFSPYMETLTIGKGLQTIEAGSFGYGTGAGITIRSITIADDNPYFKVVDGILYSKDGKTLVKYPALREGTDFTIDNTVEKIWDYAFECTQNLKNVVIPNNVTEIGTYAFHLSSISSVSIGTGVQTIPASAFESCLLESVDLDDNIKTIGDHAFYCCYELETANFGSNVKTIGYEAFYNSALTQIVIPNNVTSIGMSAFRGTNYVTNVSIGSGIETIPNNAFNGSANYTQNPTLTIGSNVEEIGINAFSGMNITGVTIPASVTTILDGAFGNCMKLTSIVIPNTVTTLGNSCFYNCSVLESVTLSTAITKIPDSAFARCRKLKSIAIPNAVQTIGESAFFACDTLETITFGTGLKTIERSAFENCSALTSITLPSGLKFIDHEAFDGCSALKTVVLPSSISKISGVAFKDCSALTSITFDSDTTVKMYLNYSGPYSYTFDTVEKTISILKNNSIGNGNYLYSLEEYNKVFTNDGDKIADETKVTAWEDRAA